MLFGIREVLVISAPTQISKFSDLFRDGREFGIELHYAIQDEPKEIVQGFIAEKFLGNEKPDFTFGDSLFYRDELGRQLSENSNVIGAQIFAYQVADPSGYGVIEFGPKAMGAQ